MLHGFGGACAGSGRACRLAASNAESRGFCDGTDDDIGHGNRFRFESYWGSLVNSQTATWVGPVYFQPLEQELGPVAHYLSGHLLNAGCGSRAVNSYLLANGVTTITNYDIASQDPEVVLGSLE